MTRSSCFYITSLIIYTFILFDLQQVLITTFHQPIILVRFNLPKQQEDLWLIKCWSMMYFPTFGLKYLERILHHKFNFWGYEPLFKWFGIDFILKLIPCKFIRSISSQKMESIVMLVFFIHIENQSENIGYKHCAWLSMADENKISS